MEQTPLTLEEKVDLILKYQTRMYRLQMTKTIIGIIIFIVLIVLPMIWFFYWIQTADFSTFKDLIKIPEVM